jgi:hypothetical protein
MSDPRCHPDGMPLPNSRPGPFLARIPFPQADVVIIHAPGTPEETRTPTRVHHQAEGGFFEVDTPIYIGDMVELPDPRGGVRHMHVTKVDIQDTRDNPSMAHMAHIHAHWTEQPPTAPKPATVYHGPVVQVTGDHAQIAWGNRDVAQTVRTEIAPGFDDLARALTATLQLLPNLEMDDEDRQAATETADELLAQIVQPSPDRSALRRGLAAVRGLIAPALTAGTTAAASAAGRSLIEQLVLPPAGS